MRNVFLTRSFTLFILFWAGCSAIQGGCVLRGGAGYLQRLERRRTQRARPVTRAAEEENQTQLDTGDAVKTRSIFCSNCTGNGAVMCFPM